MRTKALDAAPWPFLLLALTVLPAAGFAAPSSDWARVERLNAGKKLIVLRTGGASVQGTLTRATPEAIELRAAAGDITIPRADVVEVRRPPSRLRRAAEFAAIGAGTGIGVAAALLAATGGSDETAAIVIKGAAIGGVIGAAAGAAAAKSRVLYRAARAPAG
jgi:hypothetical protein